MPATTLSSETAPAKKNSKPRRARTEEDDRIDALWLRYKSGNEPETRNDLVLAYAPLVKYVAARVGTGLPNTMARDDLIQYGMIGLHDAIEKFDLDRGLKFETYAITRIRGAIIDNLRNSDWVPRSVRTKIKNVERAQTHLEMTLHRTPSEREVAEHLGIELSELRTIYEQASFTTVAALDEVLSRDSTWGSSNESRLGDRISDQQTERPGEALEDEETRQALAKAISALPERDRIVLCLYYYENLTLAEIGIVLNVTESRVCQLHTKACYALRDRMQQFRNDDDG